jgi:hypothetical protein
MKQMVLIHNSFPPKKDAAGLMGQRTRDAASRRLDFEKFKKLSSGKASDREDDDNIILRARAMVVTLASMHWIEVEYF